MTKEPKRLPPPLIPIRDYLMQHAKQSFKIDNTDIAKIFNCSRQVVFKIVKKT